MCFRALVLTCLFSVIAFSNPTYAQSISGSIRDSGDNPIDGAVWLFDSGGANLGEFRTDHLGNFQTPPLANDTYFIYTIHTGDMLDEAWDEIPCENRTCNITASTPIVITGVDRSGIDFVLEPILSGGRISGHVQDASNTPVPGLGIVIRNSKGEHIFQMPTDPAGDYQTVLFADDSYFVHTADEPWGLGRELYNNIPCDSPDTCWDSAYIVANATELVVSGVDRTGIDFNLEIPAGGMISGQVSDADLGRPLADVHMNLLTATGGYLANTNTDALGNYHFSGLDNGAYKVIALEMPQGYTIELYGGDHCPEASCDLTVNGMVINVNAGSHTSGRDIALDHQGTRIFGTITRSDSGAPVTSLYAHTGVDLFSESGDYLGFWPTSRAGQFHIEPPGAGNYYLVTSMDVDFQGLFYEAWDDVRCVHDCNPLSIGASLIAVTEGNTFVADFELDPGFSISGTIQFEGAPTSEGHVNIWDAGGLYVASAGNDGGGNWQTEMLDPGTYYATARGEEFGLASQLYSGLPCPQEYCDVTAGSSIVVSDSHKGGIDFNLAAISADWTISGSIRDSGDNPVGGAVSLFDPFGQHVGEFGVDGAGNFQSHRFPDGTYFAVTVHTGDMLDEAWNGIPCENLTCDIPASDPIVINGADRGGIDFVLEPILDGGRISGHLQDGSSQALPAVDVEIRNSKGEHLFQTVTDPNGDYQTELLSSDSYYVNTLREPLGLGRELYDNVPCIPADICGDPAYVTANAGPVVIADADRPGIDFTLEVPAGGRISGQVSDAGLGIPMSDVHLDLLNEFGDYLANTDTDALGNYYFSALTDGNYKVLAIGVPQGYTIELYDGDHCPDVSCDLNTTGTAINISGGSLADGKNIALDYEGTRIFGTVTRSDSGAPVSSLHAHMGIDLFSESGDYLGFWNTNRAGQFQIEPPAMGNYYLVTSLDMDYHGLIREAWDDVKCIENCHPPDIGANLITVLDGNTFVANFELDPGFNISGTIQFEGVPMDSGHVNIWDAGGLYVASAGNDGGGNWRTPLLAPGTYYATARGEESGMVSQLYNGLSCPQEFCDVTSGTKIVLSDNNASGVDFNLEAISADWTISGTVLDNKSNPLGGAVRLFDPLGNYLGEFWLDEFGNYQTHPVANGTYFVVTIHTGDMLDQAWDNILCENLTCDIPASTPIVVSGSNRDGIDFMLDPIVQGGRIHGQVRGSPDTPLAAVMVVIKNHRGEHVFETFTDPNGSYQSDLLANDSYFVHTLNEPLGMSRELFDDVPCIPADVCNDPGFITSQGTAVTIDGTDETGIDFTLEVPAGGLISGRVGDADIGIPLPDVHMNLLNEFGGELANTNTDALGKYYFSGLDDGNYKVIAIGVPHPRYTAELYGGDYCPDWQCDLNTAGTVIPISGGAVSADRDIELDYVGMRIVSTVTRSDTGEPVSSLYAHAVVDLYNSAGEYMLSRGTNQAGQVQFHPRNPRDFYLVFINDWNFHGLLNEVWDDIRCFDNCNPLDIGATKITVPEGTTVVADFIVDPEVAFKDGFE